MSMLGRLAELTTIALSEEPSEALGWMRQILRHELNARDVAFVHGDDAEGFARLTDEDLPANEYLWVIQRKLTDAGAPLSFTFEDGRPRHFRPIDANARVTAFAARPGGSMAGAEMIVARGDWPNGIGEERLRFFEAALSPATIALQRRLEDRRAVRDSEQVSALSQIARLLSDSDSVEDVLTKLCTIIAGVSEMTNVTIDVYDANQEKMVLRSMNDMRIRSTLGEKWKASVRRPNPIQSEAFRTRSSVLMPDIQNDARIDERSRQFFRASLIRSACVTPLMLKNEPVGCISFASNAPRTFENLGYLEGLASQAALAIRGVQMYHELAESRRALEELNERLRESMRTEHHLARTDALTGIPNRRYIDEVLHAECERARSDGEPLSIAMADIDYFKQINDTHGHEAGDEVLRQVGALARAAGGEHHVAGRYGGDEFIFVMPSLCLPHASETSAAWHELIAGHEFWIDRGQKTPVTVSIGVAEGCESGAQTVDELVQFADSALYDAKRGGRNRVVVYGGEHDEARRVA